MPRMKRGPRETGRRPVGDLAAQLADELRNSRESGQPMIEEQEFPTGKLRVTVIWDVWDRLSLEDRTATVFRAYELAEGPQYSQRIALASGLTVPEAHAAGMLPYQIIPALREGDPVTVDECRQAMIQEGASTLVEPENPQLRFPTDQEAEACRRRLVTHLPKSEPVWHITRDVGRVEDWAQADA
jgi:hypothetical protein